MADSQQYHAVRRREFLSQLGLLATASGAAWTSLATTARGHDLATHADAIPSIQLGDTTISRLVAGWNPIGGHSYLGPHMNQHMREYFTVDQTVEFLLDCEHAGITAHQFSMNDNTPTVLRRVRDKGSQMRFFGLHAGRETVEDVVRQTQPFALVHHGGVTDQLFHERKQEQVHDYVKAVHDQGLLAGVSAHNPGCIRAIADAGWKVDFFMCCFYFLTRKSSDEGYKSPETLQIAYPFYRDDPRTMTQVMRQVDQPCLGFKILGAGRLCASQTMVRNAFEFAFEHIKPEDGVIVGMYPRFFDEISANSRYTSEFSA
jgi:hypothetical protein